MRGKILAFHALSSSSVAVTLEVAATPKKMETLKDKPLEITFEEWSDKRSLRANRFFWACVGDIANAMHEDKDRIYKDLLRHYGQFDMIQIPKDSLRLLKAQWRDVEVVGDLGDRIDVLCYYGSHTYNRKEFARLLDGMKDMMRDAGLEPPPDEEMKAVLERMEA